MGFVSNRLLLSTLILVYAVACMPLASGTASESQSLALLVETIDSNLGDPAVCSALMRGMLSGLEGRRNVMPPPGWRETSARLTDNPNAEVRELSSQLSRVFGDAEATARALALLTDATADIGQRRSALRSLLTQQNDRVPELLDSLLDDPAFTLDAIRGYSMVAKDSAPSILLGKYPRLSSALRRAVVETLATRKEYAQSLLVAMRQGIVQRSEVPPHIARSLADLLGDPFIEIYGDVRAVAVDRERLIAKYKAMITPDAIQKADASRGRVVFQKTCAACHLLYGEGGKVGPDLTGSNRANLDYILLNSVDPSYDVPDAYKMVQILTVGGRLINGVLAEEDAIRVVLKTAEQPRVVIAKEDIDTRRVSPQSMMPDGQLDQMKSEQVIDLIKYLQTTQQVELAK
ncbi:Cytochrome c [Rubripirellula lacrimiformis]|uniref:Cytochrome c n=1 Tax=Rubripirellula lacrimiformis TaxID=1930273 RepID=A0A517N4E2_9BACT|nr:c-type cytochrome [Rubripirellula lacrimiformis]QDT02006.1 Cytochrome c [Rubripirellula lacrimiformis]